MPYKDKAQQRAFQRAWTNGRSKRRRNEWVQANGPCKKCGSTENLEVDHIDSTEKKTHGIWHMSPANREAELAKCQVLCTKCHTLKSSRIDGPAKTGDHNALGWKRGCRCQECFEEHVFHQMRMNGMIGLLWKSFQAVDEAA